MKILHVPNFFKPFWEYGGTARSVYEMSRALIKRGHEVTVYTTACFKPGVNVEKNKAIDVDGIRTYYFSSLSNYLTRNMLPIPYYSPFVARKEIKNFDIIHLHDYRTLLNVVVSYYARKYKVPYILQPHGAVPRLSKSKQKTFFDAIFSQAIVKGAEKIIATSKIESDQFFDAFPDLKSEKIIHIPHGIDLEVCQDLPKKGEFKRRYSIDGDEKVILFLSRLHERKGADILIEAFKELKNELKEVKLVIAGPDEGCLYKLKRMVSNLNIENDVLFTGSLYERVKLEAYVDADVFVLPSKDRYESFGIVVLEAFACGTPVIVTNNCGVSEWFDTSIGYVVECDKSHIHSALYKLLTEEDKRGRMCESAKKFIRGFSWDNIAEKIEETYENVVSKRER